jgi:broad specificity phosphatase PhoE
MTGPIWLVRHASTEWTGARWCGRTDLPLSATGVAEANDLAGRLASIAPAGVALVSSPARRARQTAEAIARRRSGGFAGSVAVDEGLREVDFGLAEGCTWAELERRLPGLAADLAAGRSGVDWPNGETDRTFRARVTAAWDRLAARDQPVVAVCHGGVIRAALAEIGLDRDPDGGWSIGPASVVELHRTGGMWAFAPLDRPIPSRPL